MQEMEVILRKTTEKKLYQWCEPGGMKYEILISFPMHGEHFTLLLAQD